MPINATYRINTECHPERHPKPWEARISRLSDGVLWWVTSSSTEEGALGKACRRIAEANGSAPHGGVYVADDEGNLEPVRPSPTYADGAA